MNISEFFRITPDNIVQCVNYIVTLKTLKSVKYLDEGYDALINWAREQNQ